MHPIARARASIALLGLLLACDSARAETMQHRVKPPDGERPAVCAQLDREIVGDWQVERPDGPGPLWVVHAGNRAKLEFNFDHQAWEGRIELGSLPADVILPMPATSQLQIRTFPPTCVWRSGP